MWIVTRDTDGEIVAGPSQEAPPVGAGETLHHVPLNTRWNRARRAFEEEVREMEMRKFLTELVTPMELLTIRQWVPAGAPTPDDLVFMWAREITLILPRINLDDPNTTAVLQMCVARNLLSQQRAAQILAGLPVL